jgi:acyl carrier protein
VTGPLRHLDVSPYRERQAVAAHHHPEQRRTRARQPDGGTRPTAGVPTDPDPFGVPIGHRHVASAERVSMRAEVRAFVVEQLVDMNYDVEGLDDDTTLGPSGVDLESLALSDLAVRVEDQFGLKFADDESEKLALMTVGEFTTMVADRVAEAKRDNA